MSTAMSPSPVQLPIRALDATCPAGFLAAVGLLSAVPGARMHFEGTDPILTLPELAGATGAPANLTDPVEWAVDAVCAELVRRASVQGHPMGPEVTSASPAWELVEGMCWASWHDDVVDAALRAMQIGAVNASRAEGGRLRVVTSSVVLISGRSYVRSILEDLWPQPLPADGGCLAEAVVEGPEAVMRSSIQRLLAGRRPPAMTGTTGLRYTTSSVSPRLHHGDETATVQPLVDLLAYLGATCLLPGQLATPGPTSQGFSSGVRSRPVRGLTWALTPVPLTLRALVDIHETGQAPDGWPAFTARKTVVPGGPKYSYFTDLKPLPSTSTSALSTALTTEDTL